MITRHRYTAIFLVLFFCTSTTFGQSLKVMTWNIRDFGQRLNDNQLDSIAMQMNNAHIVTIQEVVTNDSGNETAGKLLYKLRKLAPSWEYVISDATDSDQYMTEKYLIYWKTDFISMTKNPWMEFHFGKEFQREPLMCMFDWSGKEFTLVTIHAKSKAKNPESELKYLKYLPELYNNSMILAGDFNVEPENSVFIPLKNHGFTLANQSIKTSFKTRYISGQDVGSRAIDNFLVSPNFSILSLSAMEVLSNTHFDFWHEISDHRWLMVELN